MVAGSFYHLDEGSLRRQIEACMLSHPLGPGRVSQGEFKVAVVPHAGYEYSGPVAAWVYASLPRANYVVLGPNHTGLGERFSVMKSGVWKTPFGRVGIHEEFSSMLLERCPILKHDLLAHYREHSIEVQLPFIQYRYGSDFKIVPISILNEIPDETLLNACELIARSVFEVMERTGGEWVVIATTDFSHYVPQEVAEENDSFVIEAILKLRAREFFARIVERSVSVCGFAPVAVAIFLAKMLKLKEGKLLKYATSGDVTGEKDSVVGYASITFGE